MPNAKVCWHSCAIVSALGPRVRCWAKEQNVKCQFNCEERKTRNLSNDTDCVVFTAINLGLIWEWWNLADISRDLESWWKGALIVHNVKRLSVQILGKMDVDCCATRSARGSPVSTGPTRQKDVEVWGHLAVAWESLVMASCVQEKDSSYCVTTSTR